MTHSDVIDFCFKLIGLLVPILIGVLAWLVKSLQSYKSNHDKYHLDDMTKSSVQHSALYDRIRDVQREAEEKYMTKEAHVLSLQRIDDHFIHMRQSNESRDKRDAEQARLMSELIKALSDTGMKQENRISVLESKTLN